MIPGAVYLEAMASRTAVMGLIAMVCRNCRWRPPRFLVDRADPVALAEAIVSAVSDAQRLERMATTAQRHVLRTIRGAASRSGSLFPKRCVNREVGSMSRKVRSSRDHRAGRAYLAISCCRRATSARYKRRSSLLNTERIDYLYRDATTRRQAFPALRRHDRSSNLLRLLGEIKRPKSTPPAQSHVR